MIRVLLALPAIWLLSACQAGTEYYGKGPLVLSESAETVLSQNMHGNNGIRENLVLAIDTRLRRMGGVYCPSSDIHACIDTGGLTASMAVDNCNKDGKYDCKVYSVIDKIVWRGPIFVRHRATGQRLPYHGVWQVSMTWDGVAGGVASLTMNQGKGTLTGMGAGPCDVTFRPVSDNGGDVGLRCANGMTAGGEYSNPSVSTVAGSGKDAEGREVSFELDLDGGRQAAGAPNS